MVKQPVTAKEPTKEFELSSCPMVSNDCGLFVHEVDVPKLEDISKTQRVVKILVSNKDNPHPGKSVLALTTCRAEELLQKLKEVLDA